MNQWNYSNKVETFRLN